MRDDPDTPDPRDDDTGALGLIALCLAVVGVLLLFSHVDWRWPAGCLAAALVAFIAWRMQP